MFIVVAASVGHASAAELISTYMKIEGVAGESVSADHPREIVLTGYTQSIGTRNCSRVIATKLIDRASPALVSRAAGAIVIPQVIISLSKAVAEGRRDFFRVTLDQVTIERIELGEQADQLLERLVLAPRAIRIEYVPQKPDGSFDVPITTSFAC